MFDLYIKPNHFKFISSLITKVSVQSSAIPYNTLHYRCFRKAKHQPQQIIIKLFSTKNISVTELSKHEIGLKSRVVNASTLANKKCNCQLEFDKGVSKIRLIGNVQANERGLSSLETPIVHNASKGFLIDVEKSFFDKKLKLQNKYKKSQIILLDDLDFLRYTQESFISLLQKKNNHKEYTQTTAAPPSKQYDFNKLPQYYASLAKSRLTGLVVLTTMAGYAMAPASFDLLTFATVSLGTAFTSSSANSINQIIEVKYDGLMTRTKNRVLVRGLLSPLHVLTFGAVCGGTGVSLLYFGVNELTGLLGALNLIIYTSIYTPMKQISIANTWVGSVVGAIPPLMGWAACTGSLSSGAFVIGGILYAWQFPHFNALSWNIRHEYTKAGYKMMSTLNPELCRKTSLRYSAALIPLSMMAPVLDLTSWTFAFTTLPLNVYFTYLAWMFYKESDSGTSRKLFRFSLVHLPALLLLMLVCKKKEDATEKKDGLTGTSGS